MLFMVKIDVELTPEMPQEQKDSLRKAENARACEMIEAGKMKRIFRIVGTTSNYGIWEADTLEELHANIGSLPLFPWLRVQVWPLIEHPVTASWLETHDEMPAF